MTYGIQSISFNQWDETGSDFRNNILSFDIVNRVFQLLANEASMFLSIASKSNKS